MHLGSRRGSLGVPTCTLAHYVDVAGFRPRSARRGFPWGVRGCKQYYVWAVALILPSRGGQALQRTLYVADCH